MTLTLSWQIILVILLSVGGAMFAHFLDRDRGGYAQRVTNLASYPKAAIHAAFGALLMFALTEVMPAPHAGMAVLAIGAVYEWAQGFFSVLDLTADVAGALLVLGYLALMGHA